MKQRFILLLFGVGFAGFVSAQSISPEVIAGAGDEGTAGATTFSWTVGEPLVETVSTGANQITQGFHQPTYFLVAMEEPLNSSLQIKVYPNPTPENVFLEFERTEKSQLVVQLISLTGELLQTQQSLELKGSLQFNLSQLSDGQYFLRVNTPEGQYDAYKIQKIH